MTEAQNRYNPVNLTDSRFWVNGFPATPGYGTLTSAAALRWASASNIASVWCWKTSPTSTTVLGSGVNGTGFNAILGYEWLR